MCSESSGELKILVSVRTCKDGHQLINIIFMPIVVESMNCLPIFVFAAR